MVYIPVARMVFGPKKMARHYGTRLADFGTLFDESSIHYEMS